MRVFIAAGLPKEICDEIGKIINELKKQKFSVRWASAEAYHVTLHFLGEQDEEGIELIKDILAKVVPKYKQAKVKLGKLNYFPSAQAPRVIHLELLEEGSELMNLQKELGKELIKNRFETDKRKWIPHITLGRAKGAVSRDKWKDIRVPEASFLINKVEFMESKLTPEGAKYSLLSEYQLAL